MGHYTNTNKIIAYVPAGRKRPIYDCMICARSLKMAEMKVHLEQVHSLKVSAGGYAFYVEGILASVLKEDK